MDLWYHHYSLCLVFGTYWASFKALLKVSVWLRITDEGSVPKCAYGPYCSLNPTKNVLYILIEVPFVTIISKPMFTVVTYPHGDVGKISKTWMLRFLFILSKILYHTRRPAILCLSKTDIRSHVRKKSSNQSEGEIFRTKMKLHFMRYSNVPKVFVITST